MILMPQLAVKYFHWVWLKQLISLSPGHNGAPAPLEQELQVVATTRLKKQPVSILKHRSQVLDGHHIQNNLQKQQPTEQHTL